MNIDDLMRMFGEMTPEKLALIREQAARLLEHMQATGQYGGGAAPPADAMSPEAVQDVVGQYGAEYVPMSPETERTAPLSPEESAKRAMLRAMAERFSEMEGAGGPPLLSRPFSGKEPDKGGSYAMSQVAAILKGLLGDEAQIGLGEKKLEQQAWLGPVIAEINSGRVRTYTTALTPEAQQAVDEVTKKVATGGQLTSADITNMIAAGVPDSRIRLLMSFEKANASPYAKKLEALLGTIAKDRNIAGEPTERAMAAQEALARLASGDTEGALSALSADPTLASIAKAFAKVMKVQGASGGGSGLIGD